MNEFVIGFFLGAVTSSISYILGYRAGRKKELKRT